MRRAMPAAAVALLLASPTVIAFYSGGFFTEPRLIAAIVAWVLVIALAVTGPAPLPRTLPGWLALGGLVFLTAWSVVSITWAPSRGTVIENVERMLLYIGALLLAIGTLRSPRATRAVEPALAAGATIVVSYGLSGRLLPGIIHLNQSVHAGGRLEQPITYWNSEGALAAVGLVLCARLAGDRTRPALIRCLAAAAGAPLGAGVYLSYSRGAIAAAGVGLVVLLAAVPSRAQLRGALTVLGAGIASAACSSAFSGVASLHGGLGSRERDGAIMLAILVLFAAAAALLTARQAVAERDNSARDDPLPGARRRLAIAAAVATLVTAALIVGGLREKVSASDLAQANASRLTSVSSNRYQYWRIGARAFRQHPLDGLGSGGFRVFWLRERPIREAVQNVHSLELEMAAELGIVGLLGFMTMIAGVAGAARRALRLHPMLAAGACAAAVTWLLHASIDWDWQLPAVSLPVVILAGALIALSEAAPEDHADAAATSPSRHDRPHVRRRAVAT